MSQVSVHQRLDEYYRSGLAGEWQLYAINGVLLAVAGSSSLVLPVLFKGEVLFYAGGILVVRGALLLFSALAAPRLADSVMFMPLGFLSLSAGMCLVLGIFSEPSALIFVFAIYFTSAGIATILFAMSQRQRLSEHWEWLMVSGAMSLNLALISLSRLPEDFIWIFAVFLGLDFIVQGSALLAASLASNKCSGRHRTA